MLNHIEYQLLKYLVHIIKIFDFRSFWKINRYISKYQLDIAIWSVRDLVFLLQLIIFALVFSLNNFSREELDPARSVLILFGKFGISKASALLFFNLSKVVAILKSSSESFPDSCNSSTGGNLNRYTMYLFLPEKIELLRSSSYYLAIPSYNLYSLVPVMTKGQEISYWNDLTSV